jgi:RNA polymerase sigma-70 factor, ECF subfamily
MPVLARSFAFEAPSPAMPCTLEELYRDHFDFVVRVARRLGGRRLSPEDVAQEVFLIVGRRLATYEPRAQVTTWLYGITLNVVRVMLRRSNLESLYRADESEGLKVPLVARDPIEVREASDLLEAILSSMSPAKRSVFLLGELDELPCAEIARRVGAKEATVWSRLHYARREFAAKLLRRRLRERHVDV